MNKLTLYLTDDEMLSLQLACNANDECDGREEWKSIERKNLQTKVDYTVLMFNQERD